MDYENSMIIVDLSVKNQFEHFEMFDVRKSAAQSSVDRQYTFCMYEKHVCYLLFIKHIGIFVQIPLYHMFCFAWSIEYTTVA